jgi:hypothetical protein
MSDDLLKRLHSLHKQATVERSHFYVGWCAMDAIHRIEELEAKLELIQEEWAGAVYGDLENGVAALNAAAATDFYKRYPLVSSFGETLNRIVDGEQDDE